MSVISQFAGALPVPFSILSGPASVRTDAAVENFSAPSGNRPSQSISAQHFGVAIATKIEQELNFELAITTRQGDHVTLQFQQHSEFQQQTERTGDDLSAQSQSEYLLQRGVTLNVVGDLNAPEQQSIEALVAQIFTASEEFLSDQTAVSLQHFSRLSYDAEQVSDFALQLAVSQRVEVQTLYQQVANFSARPHEVFGDQGVAVIGAP